jgi:hypothetical protein
MNTGINENELRELAYNIWEAEGKPPGQAERHWNMALALAESEGEQYLTGDSLSGENFLGDGIISDNRASILPNDREYSELAQSTSQYGSDGKSQQPPQRQIQQQPAGSTAQNGQDQNKKRPGNGRKKSPDNILV